jgi:hypothetical protein
VTVISRSIVPTSILAVLGVFLSGCSLSNWSAPSTNSSTAAPQISGVVHGGQQPVSGATIQLYSVNTTTTAGASTPMLTSAVTTGSDGSFNITNLYTCPASNPLVYLLSTGGNPGLTGSVNNTDISLMAAIGTCTTLMATPYIVINELTTVAAAEELYPFMTDGTHVGTNSTNLLSIAGQFQSAASILPAGTGQFYSLSLSPLFLQWTTAANILAACVNTTGSSSGPCGQLLSLTGGSDTLSAAVQMAKAPTSNASGLYALITATPPFQPYFTSVPSDLTVTVGYPLPTNLNSLQAVAFNSNGQIWAYTDGYSYNTMTNVSTDLEGVITIYDNNLNPTGTTISPGAGGLYYTDSMVASAAGNVYAVNANNTISEFGPSGSTISPALGWSTGIAATYCSTVNNVYTCGPFTGTGTGNSYASNQSQVGPIRVDSQGNVWGELPYSGTNCYFEMNSSGTVTTPTGICATVGYFLSQAPEPDGSGNAWFDGSTIAKANSSGVLAATAPTSQSCFYPSSSLTSGQSPELETDGILYDHVNNQLWGHSSTGAGAITDGGTAVFCDVSPTLPVTPTTTSSTIVGSPFTGNSQLITSEVLDGAGNLWFLTSGVSASGTVTAYNSSAKVVSFSGTVTYSTSLGEISPSGTLLKSGMQPSGLGANGGATVTNAAFTNAGNSASLLGVDNSGNIWAYDQLSGRVIKISGTGAVANTVNY